MLRSGLAIVFMSIIWACTAACTAGDGTVRQGLVLECLVDANCDDGDPCTVDTCHLLMAGVAMCIHDDVGDPLCCADVHDCTVPNGCQTAQCIPTTHTWSDCVAVGAGGDGCCALATQCAPRQCHTVACSSNQCVYTATPSASGCCSGADTCPEGNSCQDKACLDATCVLVGKPGPGCCMSVSDCPAPACQVSECSDNRCRYVDACDAPLALLDARARPDAMPATVDAPSASAADAPIAVDAGPTVHDAPIIGGGPDGPAASEEAHLRGGGGCALAGGPPSSAATFLVVAMVILSRSVRRRGSALLVALLCLSSQRARADDAFDSQTFRPAATAHDLVGIDAPDVLPTHAVSAALHVGLTHAPLVVARAGADTVAVSSRLDAQIAASLGLGARLEVGFLLPVLLAQGTGMIGDRSSLSQHALGDLQLEAKIAVVRDVPVKLALAGSVGIPLGGDDAFYSGGSVAFRPRVVAGAGTDRVEVRASAGAILRATRRVLDIEVGPAVTLGGAVRIRPAAALALVAAVDAQLASGAGSAAVELLGGPEVHLDLIELQAVVGRGMTDAVGMPDWRVVLTVRGASPEARPVTASAPPPPPPPSAPPPPPVEAVAEALPEPTPPPATPPAAPSSDETTPALATLEGDAIVLRQQIYFEPGEADIKPASHRLLQAIAGILARHRELTRVRIEGYTDDRGDRMQNVAISQARAEAVRRWLVTDGKIAPDRVEAQGFGPERPLASNRTAAGRAKNRRCDIVVVERAPGGS